MIGAEHIAGTYGVPRKKDRRCQPVPSGGACQFGKGWLPPQAADIPAAACRSQDTGRGDFQVRSRREFTREKVAGQFGTARSAQFGAKNAYRAPARKRVDGVKVDPLYSGNQSWGNDCRCSGQCGVILAVLAHGSVSKNHMRTVVAVGHCAYTCEYVGAPAVGTSRVP